MLRAIDSFFCHFSFFLILWAVTNGLFSSLTKFFKGIIWAMMEKIMYGKHTGG